MQFAHIKQIKGTRSLYGTFLSVTLVPLFIFGVIMMIYSSYTLTKNMQNEVSENLRNVGVSVLAAYDALYDGDYNVMIVDGNIEYYKGDTLLSGDYSIIDTIKSQSDVDITMFFYDTRVLTTITDVDGNRYINSGANATILNSVVENKQSNFYSGVDIGANKYFAYYQPIMSRDNQTCLGMIGLASPAAKVSKMIQKSVFQNILIMLVALLLTAYFIMHFSSGIILIIKKIMKFLSDIADGNLSTEIDPVVVSRSDELGEMGRLTLKLRTSLSKLIERDALTGIYNRRYGTKKLEDIMKKGIPFSLAIGDIDFFKKFNDKFGHDCGDVVLIEVAKTLGENMRTNGFAARWGGEEFLLVFENMDGLSAQIATEKILNEVRERLVEHDGQIHSVTMSFGVTGGSYKCGLDENVKHADDNLYAAKEGGRNQVIGQGI